MTALGYVRSTRHQNATALKPPVREGSCASDPDAGGYEGPNFVGASRGFTAVFGSCRNAHRQERITLFADIKPKGMTDATFFRYMILQAKQKHPELTKGLNGIVYDMALSSADSDAFLDAGIIPISKVPRTSGGYLAMSNLGEHTFKLRSGNQISKKVVAVDGPATIEIIDSNGKAQTVPLTKTKTIKRRYQRRYTLLQQLQSPRPSAGAARPRRGHHHHPPGQHHRRTRSQTTPAADPLPESHL